jgi:hypothetical protein
VNACTVYSMFLLRVVRHSLATALALGILNSNLLSVST